MQLIELTQGKVALVDDEDYPALSAHKWYASLDDKNGVWYAKRNVPVSKGKQTTVRMHCEIIGTKGVDHRDGDGLNNQRHNLRPATMSQNCANRRKPNIGREPTSQYRGVHRKSNKWVAAIAIDKRPKHLGYFPTEVEAARAYDKAAKQHYGEFARLNFEELPL